MITTRRAHFLPAAPTAAATAALLALAGCASVPAGAGFDDVRHTVTERTGSRIHWYQGTDQDEQVEHAIGDLFARPLTPDAAAQIALLSNRALQATYEDLMIAQTDLVSAGLLRNPIFSAEAKFFSGGTSIELGLTQTFLDLLFLPMRRRIAASEFESAKKRIAAEVLALDRDTRSAFYQLQAAQQRLDMRRQILSATEASAILAQRLREAGNITEVELATEQALHEESRLALAAAEFNAVAARERLNQLMGVWGQRATYSVEPHLPDPPAETLTADEAEHLAIEYSLDLAASRQEITTAATRLGIASPGALYGNLELGAAAEREEDGEWGLGPAIAVPLPLWSQGQPATAAARAELRRATSAHAAAVVRLRSQTRTAHAQLAEARQRIEHLRTTILPLRQHIVSQSMLQYNAMQIGTVQLLAARRDQIRAGESLIQALEDYWTAHSQLRYLLGGQLPAPDHDHAPMQASELTPDPAPDTHDHTPAHPEGNQ
jgi:outer membrane protein, heavy metal efflux system